MTVLATFEIGTGGSPSPGQGRGLGAARGTGRAEAVGQSFFPALAPGAESFRAGWQSLLASLASRGGDLSETEVEAERTIPFDGTAPKEAAGNKSAAAPPLSACASLRVGQGTQEQSKQAGATTLSPVVARAGAPAAQAVSGAAQQPSTRRDSTGNGERKPATEPDSKTDDAIRPAPSIHLTKPEVVPDEAIQGVVPAANASVAQSLSAAEILGVAAHSTDVKEQIALTGLAIDLPTVAAPDSSSAQASAPERPSVAATAKTAPRDDTQEWATAEQQGPVPPAPMPSGSSGPLLTTTESPQTKQDVVPQAARVSQEGAKFDRPVAGEKLTQTMLSSRNPDPADVPGPRPTQATAAIQNPVQRPAAVQDPARRSTRSQNVAPQTASGQNSVPTTELRQIPAQKPSDLRNQDRALTDIQNVAPPLASSLNPAQDGPSSQTPMQTEARPESPVQRIAQNQNEAPMQPVKQESSAGPASTGNEPLDSLPVALHAASLPNQTSALPHTVNRPGPAASGKISTPNTSRLARESGNLDALEPGGRVTERQPFVPAVNLSGPAHDLLGAQVAIGNAGEPAGASASTASGPDSRETFATLDAVNATGKPTLIHAAPQRAEAGFHDPALGWVGVRADTSGGGVHAELVPNSADAAQALGTHLAGLNAYLAERHTPVETLTLSAPESEGTRFASGQNAGQSAGQGAGQGTQQGTGQQTGQEPAQGAESGSTSGPAMKSTALPLTAAQLSTLFDGLERSNGAGGPGGIHISVMA
ncbi:MAG: hypothetical protein ABSD44_14645 [Terracidiphilus sp.]